MSTVVTLLGKCRQADWRVALRAPTEARAQWFDEKLWLGPKDGFLPHGISGGPYDARQPILLTHSVAPMANAPQALMLVEGADFEVQESSALKRTLVIFDGRQEEDLTRARAQWTQVVDSGIPARYWSEDSGRWAEKTSRNT